MTATFAAENLAAMEDRAFNAPTRTAYMGHLAVRAVDGGYHYSVADQRIDRQSAVSRVKTFLAGSPTMNEGYA